MESLLFLLKMWNMILIRSLRIEQQKSNTSHITITALQNKFKEFLQNKTEIDEENEKNKVIEEETEQQKQKSMAKQNRMYG